MSVLDGVARAVVKVGKLTLSSMLVTFLSNKTIEAHSFFLFRAHLTAQTSSIGHTCHLLSTALER